MALASFGSDLAAAANHSSKLQQRVAMG